MHYNNKKRGQNMKLGDLVKNVHTKEVGLITVRREGDNYVVVSGKWLVPIEHLEVISESR